MGKQRNRGALCVYCGILADTRDHVPPKTFFPEPLPSDLITVPSCRSCNKSFELDDQYVFEVMLMRDRMGDSPHFPVLQEKLARNWSRNESIPLRVRHLASSFDVPMVTPAGLHVGKAPAYQPDWDRVRRVVERCARGLHFHETSERLRQDTTVTSTLLEGNADLMAESLGHIRGRPITTRGGGVIDYAWNYPPGDTQTSIWVVEFYRVFPFVVLMLGADAREAAQREAQATIE